MGWGGWICVRLRLHRLGKQTPQWWEVQVAGPQKWGHGVGRSYCLAGDSEALHALPSSQWNTWLFSASGWTPTPPVAPTTSEPPAASSGGQCEVSWAQGPQVLRGQVANDEDFSHSCSSFPAMRWLHMHYHLRPPVCLPGRDSGSPRAPLSRPAVLCPQACCPTRPSGAKLLWSASRCLMGSHHPMTRWAGPSSLDSIPMAGVGDVLQLPTLFDPCEKSTGWDACPSQPSSLSVPRSRSLKPLSFSNRKSEWWFLLPSRLCVWSLLARWASRCAEWCPWGSGASWEGALRALGLADDGFFLTMVCGCHCGQCRKCQWLSWCQEERGAWPPDKLEGSRTEC